jgi:cytochrome d ubiquinol oxidase subunit I
VPDIGTLFWSFRIMVGLGFYFIAFFALLFWDASHRNFSRRWLLRLTLLSLPLPWIAAELGWVVAEYGRQPWSIDGVLPTFLAVSSVSVAQVLFSLAGFVLFYSALLVVDIVLMLKYTRMGPVEALKPSHGAPRPAAMPAE